MRRTNKIIMVVSLVAVLLLGVGYAAIQNITVNISGTATADPSQANFVVRFSGEPQVSDSDKVTASVTDNTNATINVEGLTSAGEIVTATYTVENASTDLSADLSVETSNSNAEYFTIEAELGKTSLVAGETTTLQVSVKLLKTPISGEEKSTIGMQLTAAPVQPGEEGSSLGGGNTGPETITLASATNDNIGYYVDLGNNIVGTESTTDDWRILYVDGDQVYAILADYLPNSTGYATAAGLDTYSTYSVYSNTSIDTLLTALTTESNWEGLANGISGAIVTGGTTIDLMMGSYGAKYGEDALNSALTSGFDTTAEGSNLYYPHLEIIDECKGYWTSTAYNESSIYVLGILGGKASAWGEGDNFVNMGLRPVVVLSTTTNSDLPIGKWENSEDSGTTITTLASLTNANIGDYIDLGNNIVGTESTTDDWRILIVADGGVRAILSDYLPNSTGYAANAGLKTNGDYAVDSATNRETLYTALNTQSNWNALANEIDGAVAQGTPPAQAITMSYNAKNGTNLVYTDKPTLDSTTKDFDLYVPSSGTDDGIMGYWLANTFADDSYSLWSIGSTGTFGHLEYNMTTLFPTGIRPIVTLPLTTNVTLVNGVWTIAQ